MCLLDDFSGFLSFSLFFLLSSTCWIVWCWVFCGFVWRRIWAERGKKTSAVLNLKKGENADIVNQKNQSFPFRATCDFFIYHRSCVFISVMVTKLATHQSAAVSEKYSGLFFNVCLAHGETFIRLERSSCLVVVSSVLVI